MRSVPVSTIRSAGKQQAFVVLHRRESVHDLADQLGLFVFGPVTVDLQLLAIIRLVEQTVIDMRLEQ